MFTSFVLINTGNGSIGELLERLIEVEGVKEAYSVYGVYDLIAKIEAETMDEVKRIIPLRIRALESVQSTLAMIVLEKAEENYVDDKNSRVNYIDLLVHNK